MQGKGKMDQGTDRCCRDPKEGCVSIHMDCLLEIPRASADLNHPATKNRETEREKKERQRRIMIPHAR